MRYIMAGGDEMLLGIINTIAVKAVAIIGVSLLMVILLAWLAFYFFSYSVATAHIFTWRRLKTYLATY